MHIGAYRGISAGGIPARSTAGPAALSPSGEGVGMGGTLPRPCGHPAAPTAPTRRRVRWRSGFSNHWKKCFQPLENPPTASAPAAPATCPPFRLHPCCQPPAMRFSAQTSPRGGIPRTRPRPPGGLLKPRGIFRPVFGPFRRVSRRWTRGGGGLAAPAKNPHPGKGTGAAVGGSGRGGG